MYEFLQQETLGLYRNLRLPCCLISEWTRSDKRILFLLSIFATPDIFLCLPFANTTDCMSPSCINIWWCRRLKVINKNFGLCRLPSPSFCAGKNTGPTLQAQRPRSCSPLISWPSVLNLLRSDGIAGLRDAGLLIRSSLPVLKNGQQIQRAPPENQKEMIRSSCREFNIVS